MEKVRIMGRIKDLTGQRFGRMVVLEITDRRDSHNSVIWKCKCDCGNIAYVSNSNLQGGQKSCGCLRKERLKEYREKNFNLTGKRFGKLVALERAGLDKYQNSLWKCKCDCGNTITVRGENLTSGVTKSCGCMVIKHLEDIKKVNSIDNTNIAIIKGLLNNNKSNTTKSGIKGVGWSDKKGKWISYIMFQKKQHVLGYFTELEDAIRVRKEAENKYFRKFLKNHYNLSIIGVEGCIKTYEKVLNGELTHFPNYFWQDINEVQLRGLLRYFFEIKLGWSIEDIKKGLDTYTFQKNKLGGMLQTVFSNSPFKVVNFVYPYKINEWELMHTPRAYWTKDNVVKAVKFMLKKEKWTEKDIRTKSITDLIRKYGAPSNFINSGLTFFDIIDAIYPNKFKPWELSKVSNNYWNIETGKQIVKWLIEKELKWDEENIKEKYNLNLFKKYNLENMLNVVFGNSPYKALNTVYPGKFKPWELKKMRGPRNYWNRKTGVQAVKWLLEEKLKWNKEEVKRNLTVKIFRKYGLGNMLNVVFGNSTYRALNVAYPGEFGDVNFKRRHRKNK